MVFMSVFIYIIYYIMHFMWFIVELECSKETFNVSPAVWYSWTTDERRTLIRARSWLMQCGSFFFCRCRSIFLNMAVYCWKCEGQTKWTPTVSPISLNLNSFKFIFLVYFTVHTPKSVYPSTSLSMSFRLELVGLCTDVNILQTAPRSLSSVYFFVYLRLCYSS